MTEAIFAPITAQGRSGVNVVRISGKAELLHQCLHYLHVEKELPARMATLVDLYDGEQILDQALCTYFTSPHSFTGEDVLEVALHASPYILKRLLSLLGSLPKVRMAEPGEFSKRAFLNGKLDLTQAEGIADLIAAETSSQHQQAIQQYRGSLGKLYESWRQELVDTMSYIESYLDFPEEDIPNDLLQDINLKIAALIKAMREHLGDQRRGEKIRNGIHITICGKPNVGKSSLLNYFSQQDTAIVSEYAGTTRDIVESYLDLDGFLTIWADTAGIHDTTNPIEQEGIRRAKERLDTADLKLLVFSAIDFDALDEQNILDLLDNKSGTSNTLAIVNKCEMASQTQLQLMRQRLKQYFSDKQLFFISLYTQQALPKLKAAIINQLHEYFSHNGVDAIITQERHRTSLNAALQALENIDLAKPFELIAEDLRLAGRALGKITGHIDAQEILNNIFSKFCIGK